MAGYRIGRHEFCIFTVARTASVSRFQGKNRSDYVSNICPNDARTFCDKWCVRLIIPVFLGSHVSCGWNIMAPLGNTAHDVRKKISTILRMKAERRDIITGVKDAYNRIASHFSSTRSYLWNDLLRFRSFVNAGDRILDLGCGNGRLFSLWDGIGVSYTGMDQSNALLDIARQKFPDAGFVEGEMTVLPFPDASFDAVFCIASFHHLPTPDDRVRALREMRRVLAGEGALVMMNWNLLSEWADEKVRNKDILKIGADDFLVPWKNSERDVIAERYYHGFSSEELEKLFYDAGFSIAEHYYELNGEKSDERHGQNIVTVARPLK